MTCMVKFCYCLRTPIFLFLSMALHHVCYGQETIAIGEKSRIHSELLDMDREIWIGLPKGYGDTVYSKKAYPVLYFFDGDSQFETFVAQRNWLSRNLYSALPEFILVGILHRDRARELTPTAMETPENWKRANFSTSGGNGKFMQFVEDELKPHIDRTYRTNGFEILSGHSFGGLAVAHALIERPDSFDAYIAMDPSVWWDDNGLLKHMGDSWYGPQYDGKIFFLAKADDPGSGDHHHSAILEFHEKLRAIGEDKKLDWKYHFYQGEDHGSVLVPSVFDALRFIFKGYQMPVKAAMKDPGLLHGHFDALSKRLGYTVMADERLIDEMARVCVRQSLFKQAAELLALNLKNYPDSPHAQKRHREFIQAHKTELGQ